MFSIFLKKSFNLFRCRRRGIGVGVKQNLTFLSMEWPQIVNPPQKRRESNLPKDQDKTRWPLISAQAQAQSTKQFIFIYLFIYLTKIEVCLFGHLLIPFPGIVYLYTCYGWIQSNILFFRNSPTPSATSSS
jgi:hypothetical protein